MTWRRGRWSCVAVAAAVAALAAPAWAQERQEGKPPSVRAFVTQTSTDKQGYETYHVGVLFGPAALDVYALYGEKNSPLIIPPAYQVAAPFGSSVGPVNEAFVAVHADCAFDSWLTIGIDGPALLPDALSSVGLPLDEWSETQGISADNGAVFFMDPAHGATTEPVVFAQLTVPAGTVFSGQVSAQGRSRTAGPDWDVTALTFSNAPTAAAGAASAASLAGAPQTVSQPPKGSPPAPTTFDTAPGGRGGRRPGVGLMNANAYESDESGESDGVRDPMRPPAQHDADCSVRGLSAVSSSCPPAAPGSAVPSSCPSDCAATVNSWYQACMASRTGAAAVERVNHMLSGDLMQLVDLCAPGRGGH